MALFGKKKITLDEILSSLEGLTDEERASLKDKLEDLYKAEDEREIDKIEAEKASDSETEEEKEEGVSEESEEIGKDVDELEEEAAEGGNPEAEEAIEEKDEGEEPETETETEEKAETEEHNDDISALYAMVADLKKTVEALAARFDADAKNEEEDPFEAFGSTPSNYGGEAKEASDVEKMKAKYWNL